MKAIDIYYRIKPLIPRRLQIFLRRRIAVYKRKRHNHVWPISRAAATVPQGWGGWPEKKRFALILNHDVDTALGMENCVRLMDLEKRLNFRSSFNFVPEDYRTPPTLRQSLRDAGFEVGVHGLKHDGKLFLNKEEFNLKAQRINHYLEEWGAVGFSSPSMLRNLDWMSELKIEYGCSTFDTDPFEPHPEGMHTIFPFIATNHAKTRSYIELPYTLPQDHCLFVILKEKDNRIWKHKLDWVAANGGMVLLNTHPDYMNFEGNLGSQEQYPADYYVDFLDYIKNKYAGQYWHVLPRDLARYWKSLSIINGHVTKLEPRGSDVQIHRSKPRFGSKDKTGKTKIWIDLDNTPHVPLFIPIARELRSRGHSVVITARDAFQVCELADRKGIPYVKIGHHYGKNPIMKIFGLLWRAAQMIPFYLNQRPDLTVSHGSRSQILLSHFLRIPSILIMDYEHTRTIPFASPRWVIMPDSLSGHLPYTHSSLKGKPSNRIRYYRGIKEDVYAPEFTPDLSLRKQLGIENDEMIVMVRPPADEAHYHTPESDVLLNELMSRICQTPRTRAILLPRNHRQELELRASHPEWFSGEKTIIPFRVIDGLDLIWLSDFAVSGGGTMNREAAALGVTVYSIFHGKVGAVDQRLSDEGRLTMIQNVEEVWGKIQFVYRDKNLLPKVGSLSALPDIIGYIEEIIRVERIGSNNRNNTAKAAD